MGILLSYPLLNLWVGERTFVHKYIEIPDRWSKEMMDIGIDIDIDIDVDLNDGM